MSDSQLIEPDRIDWLQALLVASGSAVAGVGENFAAMPIVHRFTPGLYIREIFMPAGTLVVTKIHKTEHPFVISQGRVSVFDEIHGVQELAAPHCGITLPGTRRALYVHEDTIWTTFHPTELRDIEAIEREIIEPTHNPLLPEGEVDE